MTRPSHCSDSGAALVSALMVTMMLTSLCGALTFVVVTDTLISANYRTAQEALYAADAGIQRSIADLHLSPDWSAILAGLSPSAFDDGAVVPEGPDGTVLDLAALTAAQQVQSDTRYGGRPGNPDTPQWQLFAHSPMSRLLPDGSVTTRAYVVIWVADDAADGDGNPLQDTNGVLLLRAQAFGNAGARRSIEARVERVRPGSGVRLSSWRQWH